MNVKYSTIFTKKGRMVYISHLDLMRLFRRAIRRAEVPFFLTGGYTPRVKLSMPMALKLGKESEKEEMTFWTTSEVDTETVMKAINSQLPQGIAITSVMVAGR